MSRSYREEEKDRAAARPKKKFSILRTTSAPGPIERRAPDGIRESVRRHRGSSGGSSYWLEVEPAAARKIAEHISWGRSTTSNRVEQGGILLGQVYRDPESDLIYAVVEDVAEGHTGSGTSTSLELDTATWKRMLDYVDRKLEADPESELRVVGWYHTHPNQLDVFMSSTDRHTQRSFFSADWHFALVLNPHRQKYRAFQGAEARECHGRVPLERIEGESFHDEARERELPPPFPRQVGSPPPGGGFFESGRRLAMTLVVASLLVGAGAFFLLPLFFSGDRERGAAGTAASPEETETSEPVSGREWVEILGGEIVLENGETVCVKGGRLLVEED